MANQIDITVNDNIDIQVESSSNNNVTVNQLDNVDINITEVTHNISVETNETPSIEVVPPNSSNVTVTSVEQQIVKVGNGIGDLHYVFSQNIPSSNWSITHNLNKKPSVTIVNSAEDVVYGDITYIDKNQLTISFTSQFSGKAYLN